MNEKYKDWIRFSRGSFATDEDWECLCEIVGADPDEADRITVYIADADID